MELRNEKPEKPDIGTAMRQFYASLSERDRRRYAAIEALRIGHGGISLVSRFFGCDQKTIRQGFRDLLNPAPLPAHRLRKRGGGRKRCLDVIPGIDEKFLLAFRSENELYLSKSGMKYTSLSHREISRRMKEMGISVSATVIKQLLKKHKIEKWSRVRIAEYGPDLPAAAEAAGHRREAGKRPRAIRECPPDRPDSKGGRTNALVTLPPASRPKGFPPPKQR